jgi:two-component system chemotaxis response regulator CheB
VSPVARPAPPLRVLLVDDSDASRGELGRILEDAGHQVLAQARDGEEALRLALSRRPDAILLDLQMPRMDGFTFLRLLMGRCPTPVIVLSSQSRRQDVFKTLELGALDFVAKPEAGSLAAARDELLAKLALVRALRLDALSPRPAVDHEPSGPPPMVEPPGVVVIGASTGGPRAVQELLSSMPSDLPVGYLLAQHMPEKFTRTFAERLGRTTAFSVAEAVHGDLVAAGRVLVSPGGGHLELRRDPGPGGGLRVAVLPAEAGGYSARYCPSVDRLFTSAVQAAPRRLCAVVLTGMGHDGAAGVQAVRAAGGLTLAEAEASAVVYGMPGAAVATGAVDEVLDLPALAGRLIRFARSL